MSKSLIIKKEILEVLADGKEHSVYEMKESLRKKHSDFEITEGIFSNSFRTLTLAGKIRNIERGVYCINFDEKKEIKDEIEKSEKKFDENKTSKSKVCLELEAEISKSIRGVREKFTELTKYINIMEVDEETISYILKVKRSLEDIEKKMGYK